MQQETSDQDSVYLISIHEALTPQLFNHIYKDSQPAVSPIQGIYSFIKKLIKDYFFKS